MENSPQNIRGYTDIFLLCREAETLNELETMMTAIVKHGVG